METKKGLGDILIEENIIAREQLNQARRVAERLGSPLVAVLLEQGLISEDALVASLCRRLCMEVFDPENTVVDIEAIREVPFEEANRYRLLPLQIQEYGEKRMLRVAMVDPLDMQAIEDIECSTGTIVEPLIARPSQLGDAIRHYYRGMVTKIISRSRSAESTLSAEYSTSLKCNRRDVVAEINNKDFGTKWFLETLAEFGSSQCFEILISLLIQKGIITPEEFLTQLRATLRSAQEKV